MAKASGRAKETLREQYLALLQSLEVPKRSPTAPSKRTPETEIISAIQEKFELPPQCDRLEPMVDHLAAKVPLEVFVSFLGFQIAPFAHMLTEVFDFLARHRHNASSSQTITELKVGRRLRFPVDLSHMPKVWERVVTEVYKDVWSGQELRSITAHLHTLNGVAVCPGEFRERGQRCPTKLRSVCVKRVQRLRNDFERILVADQSLSENEPKLPPDLKAGMDRFIYGAEDWAGRSLAADCLGGQNHWNQSEPDLFTQKALVETQSTVDRARSRLQERVELMKEFLRLPYWKRRSDLYEVWVLVALCNELPRAEVRLLNTKSGTWRIPGNLQGGQRTPVLSIRTRRGCYLVYTGRVLKGRTGLRAMPDWLFCRSENDTPEFILECKCGSSYRYARTVREPMVKRYLPLLPDEGGKAVLVNYRRFSGARPDAGTSLPPELDVYDELAPRMNTIGTFRSAVVEFFSALDPNTLCNAGPLDLAIAFDATASMRQHRDSLKRIILNFLSELKGAPGDVRVALVAVGDHPEDGNEFVTRLCPFVSPGEKVRNFVESVPESIGCSADEAYEDALRDLVALPWRPGARKLVFLIGDAKPHEPDQCPDRIDWNVMVQALANQSVQVTAFCLALGPDEQDFFTEVATVTRGQAFFEDDLSSLPEIFRTTIIPGPLPQWPVAPHET